MGGACGACGREEKLIGNLAGKPEEKRPIGKPRRRYKYNIKIKARDIEGVAMNLFNLA